MPVSGKLPDEGSVHVRAPVEAQMRNRKKKNFHGRRVLKIYGRKLYSHANRLSKTATLRGLSTSSRREFRSRKPSEFPIRRAREFYGAGEGV